MSIARPLLRCALVAACVVPLAAAVAIAQQPPRSTADTATAMLQRVGTSVTVRSGAAALAAFRPTMPAVDAGGECLPRAADRPGVRTLAAYYPTRDSARSVVTITVDSAGELLRYSERRGRVNFSPGTVLPEQALAARLAEFEREPATTITLDLVTGMAMATNTGGDSAGVGVRAPVDAILDSEMLGRPRQRARAVQALCGGPALRVASTTPDSLSTSVVAALYASTSPEWLRLRVGEAAPALPASAIPAGAEVLGSGVVSGRWTTALLVPHAADSARHAVEAGLLAAGWERPPAPDADDMFSRGFLSSAAQARLQPPGMCSDGTHLTHTTARWSDGRTLLRLVLTPPSNGGSICNRVTVTRSASVMRPPFDSVLPELHPPPGVTVQPRGYGSSGATYTTGAVVTTPIAMAELMRHYGAQMRAAGWTLVEETPGSAVHVQLWRTRGPGAADGEWHALLSATDQPGGGGRSLMLRLEREERR